MKVYKISSSMHPGMLYYLDDDIYHWDEFTGLAVSIGSWFRTQPDWLTPQNSELLGSWLRDVVVDAWRDRHKLPDASYFDLHQDRFEYDQSETSGESWR